MTTLGLLFLIAAGGAAIPAGIWTLSWRLDVAENCPPGEVSTSLRKACLWSALAVALAWLAWRLA